MVDSLRCTGNFPHHVEVRDERPRYVDSPFDPQHGEIRPGQQLVPSSVHTARLLESLKEGKGRRCRRQTREKNRQVFFALTLHHDDSRSISSSVAKGSRDHCRISKKMRGERRRDGRFYQCGRVTLAVELHTAGSYRCLTAKYHADVFACLSARSLGLFAFAICLSRSSGPASSSFEF